MRCLTQVAYRLKSLEPTNPTEVVMLRPTIVHTQALTEIMPQRSHLCNEKCTTQPNINRFPWNLPY